MVSASIVIESLKGTRIMTVRTTLPLIALTIALQPAHVSAQNTISY